MLGAVDLQPLKVLFCLVLFNHIRTILFWGVGGGGHYLCYLIYLMFRLANNKESCKRCRSPNLKTKLNKTASREHLCI